MKKTFVLSLIFFILSFNIAYAQTAREIPASFRIEYTLPYPGLLPDNTFYFFKIARDRTIEFLIGDPVKKAEFFILQADKRLNAAFYIVKKGGKSELISSTVTKSEKYLEQALEKAEQIKREGKESTFLFARIAATARIHEQALKDLEEISPKDQKETIQESQKRIQQMEVKAIKSSQN